MNEDADAVQGKADSAVYLGRNDGVAANFTEKSREMRLQD
jgi:hypothetical protein